MESGNNVKRTPGLFKGPWIIRRLVPALLLMLVMAAPALAQNGNDNSQAPLTQADLDAYIYLVPRLTPEVTRDPARANQLLVDVGITKKRAVYVGAKIAIAQAMAIGALSPQQLTDNNVPLHLQPSPEEVSLVNTNLASLTLAQETARRAAATGK